MIFEESLAGKQKDRISWTRAPLLFFKLLDKDNFNRIKWISIRVREASVLLHNSSRSAVLILRNLKLIVIAMLVIIFTIIFPDLTTAHSENPRNRFDLVGRAPEEEGRSLQLHNCFMARIATRSLLPKTKRKPILTQIQFRRCRLPGHLKNWPQWLTCSFLTHQLLVYLDQNWMLLCQSFYLLSG